MRTTKTAMLAMGLMLASTPALAEQGELTVGIEGSVLLPSFQARDTAAISLATWAVGPVFQYGLLDDLFLQMRGRLSVFGGEVEETRSYRGRDLTGVLSFDATQFGLEWGARYNVFAGHNIAPYVEANAGFVWTGYRNLEFLNDRGESFGLDTPDDGEVGLTLSAGAHVDFRVANLLMLGIGFRFGKVFSERYQHYFEVPLSAQFFF